MSDRLHGDLEQLYKNLDAALPSFSGNHCGDCKACCTAEGLSRHHVSQLELDFLASHVGAERSESFRRYAERDKTEAGGHAFEQCPFYDDATRGCGIYSIRPFSCRIFGHFRATNSRFPEGCVFVGHETEFNPQQYLTVVPQARQLRELMRLHFAWREAQPVRYVDMATAGAAAPSPQDLEFLSPDDPYDRAIQHQLKGELPQALETLMAVYRTEGESAYLMYSIGMVLELMGAHDQSIVAFLRATELVPDCATFHYHIGYNSLSAGHMEPAKEHLGHTIRLNPKHGLALGFLGYLHLIEGKTEVGAHYLETAVSVDPDNGFFHLRLGLAWITLGRFDEGVAEVQRAADFEPTRQQALEILKSTAHAPVGPPEA